MVLKIGYLFGIYLMIHKASVKYVLRQREATANTCHEQRLLAVLGVLKLEFAKSLALGSTLADVLKKQIDSRFLVRYWSFRPGRAQSL